MSCSHLPGCPSPRLGRLRSPCHGRTANGRHSGTGFQFCQARPEAIVERQRKQSPLADFSSPSSDPDEHPATINLTARLRGGNRRPGKCPADRLNGGRFCHEGVCHGYLLIAKLPALSGRGGAGQDSQHTTKEVASRLPTPEPIGWLPPRNPRKPPGSKAHEDWNRQKHTTLKSAADLHN